MTPEEQIAKMTKAINQAIKVMGDTFGSTPGDITRAIQTLKESLPQPAAAQKPKPAETKPAEANPVS
ncbi:MAG TPA: hypothetical protein VF879_05080 [Nitrospirales bacterium]